MTTRRSVLVSHQPLGSKDLKDLKPLPEERKAERALRERLGLGYTMKAPVYSGWGLSVEARGLSAVSASPLSGADLASEFGAAAGVLAIACTLFDVYLTEKNKKGDWHDYLAAALMRHHEQANLQALNQGSGLAGHAAPSKDETRLRLNVEVLTQILVNFENAYYKARELPFLVRVRQEIDASALSIASSLRSIEALSFKRRAIVEAFMDADDAQARERLADRLQLLDSQLQDQRTRIEDGERRVKQLMSRRRLRELAKAQLRQVGGRHEKALELAQTHASLMALACQAMDADLEQLKSPDDPGARRKARALDAEMGRLRQHRHLLEAALPEWRDLLASWQDQHAGAEPGDEAHTALLQTLVDGLDVEARQLQEEIDALGRDWARPFHPYQGLGHQAIKAMRDVKIQLPRAAVDATNLTVSFLHHIHELVGAALGGYGLSLLSALLALLMARGETQDSKREQGKATQAKLNAWTLMGNAAEVERATRDQEPGPVRALAHAVCTTLISQAERSLLAQHRASKQGQTRGAKGKLSYFLIAFSVLGGIGAVATGGGTLAFWAIPQGLLGSFYLGSIGWRAAQNKGDKDAAKARHALARAFVRHFGMPAVMGFYIDMDSQDAGRIRVWRQRLIGLRERWTQLHSSQEHFEANDVYYRIGDAAFRPMAVWDNEFLAMICVTEQLHRHARDQPGGPDTAAQLLMRVGMDESIVAHLLHNLEGFITPAQHRQSTRTHTATLYGAKLHPAHRLPGDVDHSPRVIAPLIETALNLHATGLAPQTRQAIDAVLHDMQVRPAQAIEILLRAPQPVRVALKGWLDQAREHLHHHFVGPHEILELQKHLVHERAVQNALALEPVPRSLFPLHDTLVVRTGRAPQTGPLQDFILPTLRAPTGPLLLELLADPSYLDVRGSLPPRALPSVSRGPRMLAQLYQASKTLGRKLRDGDLDLDKDAVDQLVRPGKAPGRPRPSSATLRPPQPGDALIEWTGAHPPAGEGFVRRLRRSTAERYRKTGKGLGQMRKNPLATPGRAVKYVNSLPDPDHQARLCGWVLRECLRLYIATWPAPQQGDRHRWPRQLLESGRNTAHRTRDSLLARQQMASTLGDGDFPLDHPAIRRLEKTMAWYELLIASLDRALTWVQFADLLDTAPEAPPLSASGSHSSQ